MVALSSYWQGDFMGIGNRVGELSIKYRRQGMTWAEITKWVNLNLDVGLHMSTVYVYASRYAESHGMEWPIDTVKPPKAHGDYGAAAYGIYATEDLTWEEVAQIINYPYDAKALSQRTRTYALKNNLKWPLRMRRSWQRKSRTNTGTSQRD